MSKAELGNIVLRMAAGSPKEHTLLAKPKDTPAEIKARNAATIRAVLGIPEPTPEPQPQPAKEETIPSPPQTDEAFKAEVDGYRETERRAREISSEAANIKSKLNMYVAGYRAAGGK